MFNMFKKILSFSAVILCLCCAPLVHVPPEINLMPLEQIGLITFSVENAEGPLGEMATQRFLEEIQWAQRGVKILEIGTAKEVLDRINHPRISPKAAVAIGEKYGVTSFFYGKITVSGVRPKIDISSIIESLRVRATFDVLVAARLISTEDGATLWTDSIYKEGNLAYLNLTRRRVPFFTVRDQQRAYRDMIHQMIGRLTRDFRPTRRRMR
jgi:hypothetical protein